jgi:site-specific recombinase XerD
MDTQMHLIEQRLEKLPWYVTEFVEYKSRKNSEETLLSYCRDYEIFFDWLVAEAFCPGPAKEVPLEILEGLRAKNIIGFETFCSKQLGNAKDTIARKISALKSLFHYLSQIAEDDDMYPYLKRNIMAKIETVREKHSEEEKAEHIASRILLDEEIVQFREFVAHGYGELFKDQSRKYQAYLRNRTRDLAIISLILGSGLRVNEVITLDIDKIDWTKKHLLSKRKGDKHEKIAFSDVAYLDLMEYKEIRDSQYRPDKSEKAFFLSSPTRTGKSQRMSKSTTQKLVDKYADAFGKGMLSVHKLRHTFATNHYKENKDIASLKRQLGHSNINTTMIYTHVFDDTLQKSVNKADK